MDAGTNCGGATSLDQDTSILNADLIKFDPIQTTACLHIGVPSSLGRFLVKDLSCIVDTAEGTAICFLFRGHLSL